MTVACTGLVALIVLFASCWFLAEKWMFQLEAKSAGQALADESFVVSILDWFIAFLEKLKSTRITEPSASHSDLEDPVSNKELTHDLNPGTHVGKTTSISNDAFLMSNAFAYEKEARFQSHPVRTRERSYKVEVTSNSFTDHVPPRSRVNKRVPLFDAFSRGKTPSFFFPQSPNLRRDVVPPFHVNLTAS